MYDENEISMVFYRKENEMTNQEIAEIMEIPYPNLVILCRDAETLPTVLALAIGKGKLIGQRETYTNFNRILSHHDREVAVR